MPRLTIGLGAILIALGVISYIATSFASWTALIPSILGVVILFLGFLAARKLVVGIILSLVVTLLGLMGTAMNVMQLGDVFAGTAERPVAVIVSTVTFVLLIVYLVLGLRWLVSTRRTR